MSANFELQAEFRQVQGKGASRRLRRLDDKLPAIVYGGGDKAAPTLIQLDQKRFMRLLQNTAVYSHILTLHLPDRQEQVVLKSLQRHPYKQMLLHADFQRVSALDKITMRVPIHFIGGDKAPGVKAGGILLHQLNDVEVRCLAKDLPQSIEVHVDQMQLDAIIHLSDLKLPAGVEAVALLEGHDLSVASLHAPKANTDEDKAPEKSPQVEATSQPSSNTAGQPAKKESGKK